MDDDEVTLAVVATQLDGVCDKLEEMHVDIKATNGRVRDHETRITRVEERVVLWSRLQAALTLAASSIAGYLGIRD